MPEYALISRIKTFGLSLNIFQANYKELNNAALLYCKNPKSLLLLAPKNRFKLATYQKEIIRLLHNYIASAISLIDHARILYNELYKTNNLFPDYPIEIKKRFAENPLAIFVVSLRQYILHFKNPIIRTGMHLTPNSFSAPLTLSRRNLEEFSGWKPKAKEFLNTQGDSVDLLKLIDEYYNLVMDFYKWFFRRQQEIHSEQFKKVETKQKELQQVAIPDLLETILPNTKKELVYDIITSIFEHFFKYKLFVFILCM